MRAEELWDQHFDHGPRPAPFVYFSRRMARHIDGRCYPWGIVMSQQAFAAVRRKRRVKWAEGLLLHELLHWAGYSHRPPFPALARLLGTY
jgi:hypothetical protein